MGRSFQDLKCSCSGILKPTPTMASKTILVLFGIIVFVALAAATEENNEEFELSEDVAAERLAREAEADPKRRRKNKKRNGKKLRKNKGRKQRKNKGVRGGQRRRPGAARAGGRQSTSSINSTCVTNTVQYMKIWKDVVSNFEAQNKRMSKQNKTGGNKSGKNGEFAGVATYLVDIGGGNKSALSCSGSTTNSGAKQLTNLTKTLFDCEKDINASCNTANFPQPNTTFIDACVKSIATFKTLAQACLDKTVGSKATSAADACTCWNSANLTTASTENKSCKASDESKAITKQLNKCKSAFGKCRKHEDDAIASIVGCSSSASDLTKKAAQLSANSNAMTAAKTKMASLASSSGRKARAVATSCAEIITKSTELITISESSTSSTSLYTISIEISTVSSSVSCSAAEQSSLSTQVTSLETAIESVDSALESVQELLETLTGSTVATSSLTTAASTATAASSGRRERLVRDLIKNRM